MAQTEKGSTDLDNTNNITENTAEKHGGKKKLLWTFAFIAIAALTVWAITSQNKGFSLDSFLAFLKGADPVWIIAAVGGMLVFIIFEGLALLCICKAFGYKRNLAKGYSYSVADIYFSAITPSATGGQPASAFFMVRDGIPGSVVTVSLLINLVMYTFAILILGIVCFLMNPMIFLSFSTLSKILIIVGIAAQIVLATVFILILKKDKLLHGICDKVLCVLAKLHLIRKLEKKREKLTKWIQSYKECAAAISGKRAMLVKALILNVLQRASLISVTVFAFLASGGSVSSAADVWVIQSMVVLGSNCVPIPGAMGVADYLMLDAFTQIMAATAAVNLELLARSVSFYFCVVLCGVSMLIRLFIDKMLRIRREKINVDSKINNDSSETAEK